MVKGKRFDNKFNDVKTGRDSKHYEKMRQELTKSKFMNLVKSHHTKHYEKRAFNDMTNMSRFCGNYIMDYTPCPFTDIEYFCTIIDSVGNCINIIGNDAPSILEGPEIEDSSYNKIHVYKGVYDTTEPEYDVHGYEIDMDVTYNFYCIFVVYDDRIESYIIYADGTDVLFDYDTCECDYVICDDTSYMTPISVIDAMILCVRDTDPNTNNSTLYTVFKKEQIAQMIVSSNLPI
jgi:hypothetical protein